MGGTKKAHDDSLLRTLHCARFNIRDIIEDVSNRKIYISYEKWSCEILILTSMLYVSSG